MTRTAEAEALLRARDEEIERLKVDYRRHVEREYNRAEQAEAENTRLREALKTYSAELRQMATAALTEGPIPGDEREHAGRWTMAEIIADELDRLLDAALSGGAQEPPKEKENHE